MKQQSPIQQTKVAETLNLDYKPNNDEIWLGKNQDVLRNTVGILGLLLPVLIYFGLMIDCGHSKPLESISHYYFTRVGSVFIIVVSLLAFFLIIYKGNREIDFWVSTIAGISALVVLLFPTGDIRAAECTQGHKFIVNGLKAPEARETLHLVAAAIFLTSLAVMSLFLFPHPKDVTKMQKKKLRNTIYRICGVLMLLFLAVLLFCFLTKKTNTEWYFNAKITYWMEALAVWSFGISWMVKGSIVKPITG
ncbi:hypothetical protein ESA94_16925 [Lacibacter luteus]|uniref:DUF998 domain-containing protein n=1 Tax=Lacibacter luteus TaxID=2508719 RepID=A0A4Q1CEQ4_9BACT|nr:hypothetical protein [Lacibacter luteus]RXK58325.1 hypothetical protein ESA94_16925 [Lacibacter luteus]